MIKQIPDNLFKEAYEVQSKASAQSQVGGHSWVLEAFDQEMWRRGVYFKRMISWSDRASYLARNIIHHLFHNMILILILNDNSLFQ